MTTSPPGGRDTSGDAQAIPQRRRTPDGSAPAHHPAPGHERSDATRPVPTRGADPYYGWHEEHWDEEEWREGRFSGASAAAPTTPVAQPARQLNQPAAARRPRPAAPATTPIPTTRPAPARAAEQYAGGRAAYDPPPQAPTGPPARGPRMPAPPRPPRRRHTFRRIVAAVVLLGLLWVGGTAWAVKSTWSAVGRVKSTPAAGHIADTEGRNYLMVGSDGRTDLTAKERNELGTGWAEGARTDSIMVLHTGGGDPTLLSIPRDSYVEIPGHGMNKINAAFNTGGPPLLAETVEKVTGLHLDGYIEIGFGGFAKLVDSVGGVRMCLPNAINDEKAHIDLPAGCQVLDGKNALGYVRMRYSDPEGDLGRVKRQRAFLGALMGKLATPANLALPWKLHSVGTSGASAITIGEGDSMTSTARAFLGLRAVAGGKGQSVTVPVANPGVPTAVGEVVEWDAAKAQALFTALQNDDDLPADLIPAK